MEDATETIPEPVESDSRPEGDPQALDDPGKRALIEERARADKAEKAMKALKARLDAAEAEKLTKEEKALKDAAEAAERATRAEAEAMRWRIAARNGISDEDAELFLTGSDEETLSKQAERFKELASKPSKGNVVPGIGNQPNTPASIANCTKACARSSAATPCAGVC